MGLTGKRGGKGGRLLLRIGLTPVGCQVVDDAGGGLVQQCGCHRPLWICQELIDLCLGQVGLEGSVQQVALLGIVLGLSHHRRSHHHAQGIKGHSCSVAVGVHHQTGLKHAVIVPGFVRIESPFAIRSPTVTRLPSASRVSFTSRSWSS